jgi:translation elongation factor EF-1beta
MRLRSSRPSFRESFPKPQASSLYRNIAFGFLGLTILVVIGALWVSSVYARVTVKVKRDTTQVQSVIELGRNPEQNQLRGRMVQGTFEKIQEFAVKETSTAEIPEDLEVKGTVKIINNYSKPQTLVKTTRLLTSDGRLYRIDNNVVVQPKQSVTVTAYSDKKGKEYVLPVGTKLTIPGLWIDLQKWIYAETVSGFSGGQQIGKIVSSMAVAEAKKALEEAVFEQAVKTLKAEAAVGEDWSMVSQKKVIDEKTNVTPGQRSDQFMASIKLEVKLVFYPQKDMDALVKQKFKERLPDGREITNFDPSAISFKIESLDVPNEKAKLSFSAQASTKLTQDSPALSKDSVAGLGLDEAKAKLMDVEGVESVDIQIRPAWIGKLPTMKDRIEMVVQ